MITMDLGWFRWQIFSITKQELKMCTSPLYLLILHLKMMLKTTTKVMGMKLRMIVKTTTKEMSMKILVTVNNYLKILNQERVLLMVVARSVLLLPGTIPQFWK